eukprot:GFKZ01011182.1.p1 GENE.GFKZ01011182.1~~GFKZ01011182.1.p1  ORF type:complete len:766 (+),score=103.12 GFKZ01011182.1:339-2636(+)
MAFRRNHRNMKETPKVGRYALLGKIGEGGFGTVRKALNTEDGTVAAIKILDKSELQLHDMTQSVKREIALLTSLDHPNIVKGREVLNSKNKLFLVMEYVDGGDMHTVLMKKKRFTEFEAQHLFSSLIACLEYCHEQGVYHRDLKLENLLLNSKGELKVCDFGLASVRDMNVGRNGLCRTIVGTEDFSPPELLRNLPYKGDEADMWSAGIILYTMLAGYCPFQGNSPTDLHQRIITCKYSFPKGFPEKPKRIVAKLLVPAATGRPSAAAISRIDWVKRTSSNVNAKDSSPWENDSSPKSDKSENLGPFDMIVNGKETNSEYYLDGLLLNDDESVLSLGNKSFIQFDHSLFLAMARANIPDFLSLYQQMRDADYGIAVSDRRYRFRVFSKCFIGSDAVTWLSAKRSCSREDATQIGKRFVKSGVFHHVCRDHDFKDEYLFYRWLEDEPENVRVLNLQKSWPRSYVRPPPNKLVIDLLQNLLSICASHQALNDFRTVNISAVQKEDSFRDFRVAAGELQIVDLESNISSDEEKISFLVNLYNLFWLQARIHIGDYDPISHSTLERKALSFQYEISGIKISLNDVKEVLLGGQRNTTSPGGSSEGVNRNGESRIRLKSSKRHITNSIFREHLQPGSFNPLVHFLVSEGSPQSPMIRPLSPKQISPELFREAASEYLEMVVNVDHDLLVVSYPEKVAKFRRAMPPVGDREFVQVLRSICKGRAADERMMMLETKSDELNLPIKAVVRHNSSLPSSLVSFAPRICRLSSDL